MSGTSFLAGERLRAAKLNRFRAEVLGAASASAAPTRPTIVAVTATTQTPAVAADGQYYRCTNASGCTVTVPPNSAQAHPIGTLLTYEQAGAGVVTFVAGAGVTIRKPALYGLTTAQQYAVVQIAKVATNEWVLYGNLGAA